jgi:iron complex outermembrane receptor protein
MHLRGRLAVGVAALGFFTSGAAWAQEAAQPANAPEGQPDVVIVTGIGPARSGDELITSTTALDADDVVAELSGGLGDTLAGLPGISTTAFGPGASRPVIRGLGSERVQVLTNGIGVIDASAASPDHAVTGDPLGAERIEILRGPATLAYGGGAAGGVVNVIDGLIAEEVPDQKFSALGYAGYTSADEGVNLAARATGAAGPAVATLSWSWKEAGDLEIPGFAESARLRALEEDEGEEHEHVEGTLENSGVESQTISGGLSFAGEAGFAGVAVRRLETKYGIVGGHEHEEEEELATVGLRPLSLGVAAVGEVAELPFIDLEQTRLDLRSGLNMSEGPIERVTMAISGVDYTHTEFEGPGEPGTVFTNNGFEARAEAEHAEFAGLKGSIGAQASRRNFKAVGDEAFVTPTVTEQAAIFAFETWENGSWGVEGGLRADRVKHDNEVFGEREFDTLNASFGVHGHATENLFLGLSVNRTERAPNDVELFADGPHLATQQFEIGDPSLTTETGLSVEGSARWEAGPLELSLSVYRFAFDDFIYLDPTGAEEDGLPVFHATQADATFTGGELTAALDLGNALGVDWRLDGSADIVRGKLDDGGDLPRIPPVSAMLGVEGEIGIVNARLEARWADEQDRVANFELPTDGWTAIDLRTTIAVTPKVNLILEGLNLTDEEIRYHASPLKDVAPMAGRGFRVALRAEF